MIQSYDLNKLESALRDFNQATGISISVYSTEGKTITASGASPGGYCKLISSVKEGQRSCARSNRTLIEQCRKKKQTVRHICGAGLLDIAIPLLHRDEIVGFLMLGQIKCNEKLPDVALSFPIDPSALEEKYYAVPLLDDSKIDSIINIATMLTKYIMFENMVRSRQKQSAAAIADYVEENLNRRITAQMISSSVHLSVAGIYKCIRHSFDCTLSEYVCSRRIERARVLLEERDISIEQIADAVGFSDPAYFSRCFKKALGISPREYRKTI